MKLLSEFMVRARGARKEQRETGFMELITRGIVAGKFSAYLHHELSLDSLVACAESALMDGEFDPAHLPTIHDVVARIGVADVRAFVLTWEDCEQLLPSLAIQHKSASSPGRFLSCTIQHDKFHSFQAIDSSHTLSKYFLPPTSHSLLKK